MPTCNLSKTIHNIWLQQFGKKGTSFFATTFDDYMQTFKESLLYYVFLQGGASRTSLDKNELRLHRANQSRDLIKIVATISKYTSSFSLSVRILHLEGEEVFGSAKHKANLPRGLEIDSHRHDQVNFSHLKVANAIAPIN
jgi:hypothetical protein